MSGLAYSYIYLPTLTFPICQSFTVIHGGDTEDVAKLKARFNFAVRTKIFQGKSDALLNKPVMECRNSIRLRAREWAINRIRTNSLLALNRNHLFMVLVPIVPLKMKYFRCVLASL